MNFKQDCYLISIKNTWTFYITSIITEVVIKKKKKQTN